MGHLYTVILGDAAHRWATIKGAKEAIYSCGTDEHGAKVIAYCMVGRQSCNDVGLQSG